MLSKDLEAMFKLLQLKTQNIHLKTSFNTKTKEIIIKLEFCLDLSADE